MMNIFTGTLQLDALVDVRAIGEKLEAFEFQVEVDMLTDQQFTERLAYFTKLAQDYPASPTKILILLAIRKILELRSQVQKQPWWKRLWRRTF